MLTLASDVADVGLRPARTSIQLGVELTGWIEVTEIESCKSKSSGHDGEEDLGYSQSMGRRGNKLRVRIIRDLSSRLFSEHCLLHS
jgi:hypothetical protein